MLMLLHVIASARLVIATATMSFLENNNNNRGPLSPHWTPLPTIPILLLCYLHISYMFGQFDTENI